MLDIMCKQMMPAAQVCARRSVQPSLMRACQSPQRGRAPRRGCSIDNPRLQSGAKGKRRIAPRSGCASTSRDIDNVGSAAYRAHSSVTPLPQAEAWGYQYGAPTARAPLAPLIPLHLHTSVWQSPPESRSHSQMSVCNTDVRPTELSPLTISATSLCCGESA